MNFNELGLEVSERMRTHGMKAGQAFLMVAAALFAAGSLAAQSVKPDQNAPTVMMVQNPGPGGPGLSGPAPFAERVELLGFGGMRGEKTVTGAPFSAEAVSQTTQTLPDGNKIVHKTQTNLYRDGQGRVRREVQLMGFGPLATEGQPRSFVVINDPVAGKSYVLEADKKIARTLPDRRRGRGPRDEFVLQKRNGPEQDNVQTSDLGTQTINGVAAQGTRYTTTIPAGRIGNEKPIVITSESWYSPDLQVLVMSKRNDPRFGETTYQLTNIQRSEPSADLFTVPADYSIKSGPAHGSGEGRRGDRIPPPPSPDGLPPGM
jgi:hypothetical protein